MCNKKCIADKINFLTKIIPPPLNPINTATLDKFVIFEEENNLVFPEDYKILISIYGSGTFCNTLYLLSPFAERNPLLEYHNQMRPFYETMLQTNAVNYQSNGTMFKSNGIEQKFTVYPDGNGLLVIGCDDNMNSLMWHTQEQSNDWYVMLFDDYMTGEYLGNIDLVEFLISWATGELCPVTLEGCIQESRPRIPMERVPLFKSE